MELRKQCLKKYAIKILLLSLLVIGFVNCGKQKDNSGFTLQEFEVINPQLKLLISSIRDSCTFIDRYDEREYLETIPVIELIKNDSTLEFGFVSAGKKGFSETYIFEENKRIVGYLHMEKDTFIILSNIASLFEFCYIFYKFVIPNGNKQQFEYISFPSYLYCVTDNGFPCVPDIFDPYYYWYTYKEGKFIFQEDFTDLKKY